ncbi:DUF4242 domain-containing protein [Aestuariivirga sp.]|uniref:DUF4242 domain-containing protein n=1 Tax=Aestuariivirga sp. TaxID=2650926 RepID=UPI00391BE7B6
MKRFVIERQIPQVGTFDKEQLRDAATVSNRALAQLAPRVQWEHSYVAADKTFCVYLAEDEAAVREHAQLSGFPANVITEIRGTIDPTTGR